MHEPNRPETFTYTKEDDTVRVHLNITKPRQSALVPCKQTSHDRRVTHTQLFTDPWYWARGRWPPFPQCWWRTLWTSWQSRTCSRAGGPRCQRRSRCPWAPSSWACSRRGSARTWSTSGRPCGRRGRSPALNHLGRPASKDLTTSNCCVQLTFPLKGRTCCWRTGTIFFLPKRKLERQR